MIQSSFEAMACREALSLGSDLYLDQVETASDCKEVVNDLLSGNGGLHGNIVREIRRTATSFQKCSVISEGRISNLEAHSLAKHSLSRNKVECV